MGHNFLTLRLAIAIGKSIRNGLPPGTHQSQQI